MSLKERPSYKLEKVDLFDLKVSSVYLIGVKIFF
jgi:hypothetical protein